VRQQGLYRLCMPALVQVDVLPYEAQVALVHAAWQDYPRWEPGDKWVAYRAPSLIHPDSPPYPGVAVATRDAAGPDGPLQVRVEVWAEDEPPGLRCVHETVLAVGSQGVNVGNVYASGGSQRLMLARGAYPLKVLVDADRPDQVSRVAFVIGECAERRTYSP
jgi:hypothetical protein